MAPTPFKRATFICSLLAILLYIAAILLDIKQFWGINIAKFLPPWWQWLTAVILLAMLMPPIHRSVWAVLESASKYLSARNSRSVVFVIFLSAILLPVWLIFNSKGYFLGDATLRLNWIAGGKLWAPTEPGDYFIHAIIDRLFLEPYGLKVAVGYHVVSALCGAIFVAGAYRLARYVRSDQTIPIFLMLLSSSITVMFFGYIESYSILAALLPFLFLSALKVVDGKSNGATFIVLFIIAALMHAMTLVILSGMLFAVLILPRLTPDAVRKISVAVVIIIAGMLIAGYVAQTAGFGIIQRYILPVFPRDDFRQGLFTLNHPLNILNWLLLSAMTGVALFTAALSSRKDGTGELKQRRKWLAFWTALPPLLFMFFFVPHLGGPRDWDLFAAGSFSLIPAAIVCYFAKVDKPIPSQILPVVMASLFVLISFSAVNSSVTRAADRFCEIIEVSRFKSLFKEYGMMYDFAKNTPELEHRALEYGHKAWLEPPYNKHDSLFMARELASYYMRSGDGRKADQFLGYAMQADSTDLDTYFLLIDHYRKHGMTDRLPELADKMRRLLPDNPDALLSAGMIFQEMGRDDRAGEAFARAYQLKPNDPAILLNLGKFLYDAGRYTESIQLLDQIESGDPFAFYAFYYKAAAWAELKDIDRARKTAAAAERIASSADEKQMLIYLKQKLNK